jgi:hypothetical protein
MGIHLKQLSQPPPTNRADTAMPEVSFGNLPSVLIFPAIALGVLRAARRHSTGRGLIVNVSSQASREVRT